VESSEAPKTREEILQMSLDARIQEVMHYQINIDNYVIALGEIAKLSPEDQAELSEFAGQLRTLLASEKLEQKKANIMLAVIRQQVEA
jgi:hypothetical protein